MAVREASVRRHGTGGGTTSTTTTTGTTTTGTTTTGTTTTGTTTTGTTTTEPDTTVASCENGSFGPDTFAPVPSAARWYSTQDGEQFMLLRTSGDWVSARMPEGDGYSYPINQHATWTFKNLPSGAGDVKVRFTARFRYPYPEQRLYVTYGPMPGSGTGRVQGTETVTLTRLGLPPIELPTNALPHEQILPGYWQNYYLYRGEVVLPRSEVSGAAGFWVRAGLYNLSTKEVWKAQAALNRDSVEVCTNGAPVARPQEPSTAQVGVTLDPATASSLPTGPSWSTSERISTATV